ncbi:MAG TPA: prepilin-type N-terminal cleavage/methylation domain-containing protein [Verrucomicrobiae bacterium]
MHKINKAYSCWATESGHLKTGFINQKVGQRSLRGSAGMTLVEVMVALALAAFTVAGIIEGYIFCTTSTVKDSLYMAANTRASERLEETRGAIWAPYRATPVDELVASNFPDQPVTLDMSGSSSATTMATLTTTITQIVSSASSTLSAPVREIRVDCIWQFKGELITNSIETCRAPDQ